MKNLSIGDEIVCEFSGIFYTGIIVSLSAEYDEMDNLGPDRVSVKVNRSNVEYIKPGEVAVPTRECIRILTPLEKTLL
jgi:hypothetical protein